jgi:allantoinase
MILHSTRVVLPDGERRAWIHIEGDRIARVVDERDARAAAHLAERSILDFGSLVISPGVVDTHVHVNEPGRTEWEGFDTATRAAAAGGITTLVDMPLNSIPATTTVRALDAKREAARGQCHVDVGFWGGVVPGNEGDLDALVDAGVRGFKCFLVPSGVDEFPAVGETDLRRAMPLLARRHVPLLVHAEAPALIRSPDAVALERSGVYASYVATRPPEAEVDAIRMMIRLARECGAHTHIVHVAAAEAVAQIERAKAEGVSITAETCPHYLAFAAEEIADGSTEFKCAPPIREAAHRSALADGLRRGVLDLVVTDHSPAPPALKCPGDFLRAWGGIASLQVSLSATWTVMACDRTDGNRGHAGNTRASLARWMSERPAALAGLASRKGRIAQGCDADFVVWDPDAEFVVDSNRLQHRHKLTPYANRRLRGRVLTTFLRGERVWDDGELVASARGRLL